MITQQTRGVEQISSVEHSSFEDLREASRMACGAARCGAVGITIAVARGEAVRVAVVWPTAPWVPAPRAA